MSALAVATETSSSLDDAIAPLKTVRTASTTLSSNPSSSEDDAEAVPLLQEEQGDDEVGFESAVEYYYSSSAMETGMEVVMEQRVAPPLPSSSSSPPPLHASEDDEPVTASSVPERQLPDGSAVDLLTASVEESSIEEPSAEEPSAEELSVCISVATEVVNNTARKSLSVVSADGDAAAKDEAANTGGKKGEIEKSAVVTEVESLLSLFSCVVDSVEEDDGVPSRSSENKENSPRHEARGDDNAGMSARLKPKDRLLLKNNRKKVELLQRQLSRNRKITRLLRRDAKGGRSRFSREARLNHEIKARKTELEFKRVVLESMRAMETMADGCPNARVEEEGKGGCSPIPMF